MSFSYILSVLHIKEADCSLIIMVCLRCLFCFLHVMGIVHIYPIFHTGFLHCITILKTQNVFPFRFIAAVRPYSWRATPYILTSPVTVGLGSPASTDGLRISIKASWNIDCRESRGGENWEIEESSVRSQQKGRICSYGGAVGNMNSKQDFNQWLHCIAM